MGIAFPGESSDYRAARDRLMLREIELRRMTEAVAAERRELPPGGVVKTQLMEVFVRRDGTWQIEAYHNVELKAPATGQNRRPVR